MITAVINNNSDRESSNPIEWIKAPGSYSLQIRGLSPESNEEVSKRWRAYVEDTILDDTSTELYQDPLDLNKSKSSMSAKLILRKKEPNVDEHFIGFNNDRKTKRQIDATIDGMLRAMVDAEKFRPRVMAILIYMQQFQHVPGWQSFGLSDNLSDLRNLIYVHPTGETLAKIVTSFYVFRFTEENGSLKHVRSFDGSATRMAWLDRIVSVSLETTSNKLDQVLEDFKTKVFEGYVAPRENETPLSLIVEGRISLGDEFVTAIKRNFSEAIHGLFGAIYGYLDISPSDLSHIIKTAIFYLPNQNALRLFCSLLSELYLEQEHVEALEDRFNYAATLLAENAVNVQRVFQYDVLFEIDFCSDLLNRKFDLSLPTDRSGKLETKDSRDEDEMSEVSIQANLIPPLRSEPESDEDYMDIDTITNVSPFDEGYVDRLRRVFSHYSENREREEGEEVDNSRYLLIYNKPDQQGPSDIRHAGGVYSTAFANTQPLERYQSTKTPATIWHTHYHMGILDEPKKVFRIARRPQEDGKSNVVMSVSSQDIWHLLLEIYVYRNLLSANNLRQGKEVPEFNSTLASRFQGLYTTILNNNVNMDYIKIAFNSIGSLMQDTDGDATGVDDKLRFGDIGKKIQWTIRNNLSDIFMRKLKKFLKDTVNAQSNNQIIDSAYAVDPFRQFLNDLADGMLLTEDAEQYVADMDMFSNNPCIEAALNILRDENTRDDPGQNSMHRHTHDTILLNAMFGLVGERGNSDSEPLSPYAELKKMSQENRFLRAIVRRAKPGPLSTIFAARFGDAQFFEDQWDNILQRKVFMRGASALTMSTMLSTNIPTEFIKDPTVDNRDVSSDDVDDHVVITRLNPYRSVDTPAAAVLDSFVAAALVVNYPTFYAKDMESLAKHQARLQNMEKIVTRMTDAVLQGSDRNDFENALVRRYGASVSWLTNITNITLSPIFESDSGNVQHVPLNNKRATKGTDVARSAFQSFFGNSNATTGRVQDDPGTIRAWFNTQNNPEEASGTQRSIEAKINETEVDRQKMTTEKTEDMELWQTYKNQASNVFESRSINPPATAIQTLCNQSTGFSDIQKMYRLTGWNRVFAWSYLYRVQKALQVEKVGEEREDEEESSDVLNVDEFDDFAVPDDIEFTPEEFQQTPDTEDERETSEVESLVDSDALSISSDLDDEVGPDPLRFRRQAIRERQISLINAIASKDYVMSGMTVLGIQEYRNLVLQSIQQGSSDIDRETFLKATTLTEQIASKYTSERSQQLSFDFHKHVAGTLSRYMPQLMITMQSVLHRLFEQRELDKVTGARPRLEPATLARIDEQSITQSLQESYESVEPLAKERFIRACEILWPSLKGALKLYQSQQRRLINPDPLKFILAMFIYAEHGSSRQSLVMQAREILSQQMLDILDKTLGDKIDSEASAEDRSSEIVNPLNPDFGKGRYNLLFNENKTPEGPLLMSKIILANRRTGKTLVPVYTHNLRLPEIKYAQLKGTQMLYEGKYKRRDISTEIMLFQRRVLNKVSMVKNLTSQVLATKTSDAYVDLNVKDHRITPNVASKYDPENTRFSESEKNSRYGNEIAELYHALRLSNANDKRTPSELYQPLLACKTVDKQLASFADEKTVDRDTDMEMSLEDITSSATLLQDLANLKSAQKKVSEKMPNDLQTMNAFDISAFNNFYLLSIKKMESSDERPAFLTHQYKQFGQSTNQIFSVNKPVVENLIQSEIQEGVVDKETIALFGVTSDVKFYVHDTPLNIPSFRHTYGAAMSSLMVKGNSLSALTLKLQEQHDALIAKIFLRSLELTSTGIGVYHIEALTRATLTHIEGDIVEHRWKFLATANYMDQTRSRFPSADNYFQTNGSYSAFGWLEPLKDIGDDRLLSQTYSELIHSIVHYYAKLHLMLSIIEITDRPEIQTLFRFEGDGDDDESEQIEWPEIIYIVVHYLLTKSPLQQNYQRKDEFEEEKEYFDQYEYKVFMLIKGALLHDDITRTTLDQQTQDMWEKEMEEYTDLSDEAEEKPAKDFGMIKWLAHLFYDAVNSLLIICNDSNIFQSENLTNQQRLTNLRKTITIGLQDDKTFFAKYITRFLQRHKETLVLQDEDFKVTAVSNVSLNDKPGLLQPLPMKI